MSQLQFHSPNDNLENLMIKIMEMALERGRKHESIENGLVGGFNACENKQSNLISKMSQVGVTKK